MPSYPFFEKKLSNNAYLRKFSKEVETEELVWHRDKEDRFISVVKGGGWSFQLDNSVPVILKAGMEFFIKKNEWHRVIRGHSDLIIKIKKLP